MSFDRADRPRRAKTKLPMDGKTRYLDTTFIERPWRSPTDERVYPRAWETGSRARAGVGRWITFCNQERPHAIRRETGPPDEFLILLKHGGRPPAVVYFNHIETDQQAKAAAQLSR